MYARRVRRRSLAAVFAVAGLGVVVACSTFESSDGASPDTDAGDGVAPPNDALAGDVASDTGAVATPCDGEPVWVTPSSPVPTATCNGASGINLLNSTDHCGRCNHSCGAELCADGNCQARPEDTGPALLLGWDATAIYYARGLFPPTDIVRLVPGGQEPKVTLYTHTAPGDDGYVSAGAVSADKLWFRTRAGIHAIDKVAATDAASPPIATMPYDIGGTLAFYGDRLLTQNNSTLNIDQVAPDGSVTPFISNAGYTYTTFGEPNRFVWVSQPFIANKAGPSGLHVFAAGAARDLWTSDDALGGLAVSGNSAWVVRRGDAGEVRAIDLVDGGGTTIHADSFHDRLGVAVDTTHVFWMRERDDLNGYEVWKQAHCGGEAVRIGSLGDVFAILPWNDGRLYAFGQYGLVSIAK